MELLVQHIDALPRLAWCAHQRRGTPRVTVLAGPWVECSGDFFFEGAWAGPFGDASPDSAAVAAGSGGRVRGARAVFCTPTHTLERL